MKRNLSWYLNIFGSFSIVAVCAGAILIIFGVQFLEIVRYLAYEVGFVFLPGWLVYMALSGKSGSLLRQIAIGWGLGYVLEILAFIAASAAGIRSWFVSYPILVVALVAPRLWRRYRSHEIIFGIRSQDTRWLWGLAIVCIIALIYLCIGFFPGHPLPETVESVDYYKDLVWGMGVAAEAKNHWPITDPHVVNHPIPYYYFMFFHMAAVSKTTGLSLPLLQFRLYHIFVLLLLAIQLYVLGTVIGKNRRIGLLTVTIILLVGEIDPFPKLQYPFLYWFFTDLYLANNFLHVLVIFIPLIILIQSCINSSTVDLSYKGNWILIALLMIGCGGTRGQTLPIIGGGLVLYLIWDWWSQRRVNLSVLFGITLTATIFVSLCLLMYRDIGRAAFIRPLSFILEFPLVKWLSPHLPNDIHIKPLFFIFAVIIWFVGFMNIRVVGLAWVLKTIKANFSNAEAWLMSLFLMSLALFSGLKMASGTSQWYYFYIGYIPACALAAKGLYTYFKHKYRSGFLPHPFITISLIAILLLSIIDTPIDYATNICLWLKGKTAYSQTNRNLTSGLLEGMIWVRDHTDTNAVLAVNNHYRKASEDARYFYYSAFTERRVFLEGWVYTYKAFLIGYHQVKDGKLHPFPERLDLNQRVFMGGDHDAVRIMAQQYSVTHLFVDKVHGDPLPDLGKIVRLVFSNQDADIYEIVQD